MTLLPTPLSKEIKDALNKQQFINECTVEYETTISKHFQHLKDPRKSGMIQHKLMILLVLLFVLSSVVQMTGLALK